jgi:hypothetical protein
MGDEAEALVDFLSDIPSQRQITRHIMKQANLICKHDIIAEWCHTCKHDNPASIKAVLRQENLAIASNLAKWEKKSRTS